MPQFLKVSICFAVMAWSCTQQQRRQLVQPFLFLWHPVVTQRRHQPRTAGLTSLRESEEQPHTTGDPTELFMNSLWHPGLHGTSVPCLALLPAAWLLCCHRSLSSSSHLLPAGPDGVLPVLGWGAPVGNPKGTWSARAKQASTSRVIGKAIGD